MFGNLFSGPPPELDERTAAVFLPPTKSKELAKAQKDVAKVADVIWSNVDTGNGEQVLAIAHSTWACNAIVVTDRRVFTIVKSDVMRDFRLSEVAETRLMAGNAVAGVVILIETITCQQDFTPDDPDRYLHYIQVTVATPRIANAICGHIDARIGS